MTMPGTSINEVLDMGILDIQRLRERCIRHQDELKKSIKD